MKKMFNHKWKAMGTDIIIMSPSLISSEKIFLLEKIFSDMEKKFSRFDKNSLITKLNTEKKLKLDKDFLEVFLLSKRFFLETGGAFNPLLSVKKIGYTDTFDKKEKNIFDITDSNLSYDGGCDFNDIKMEGDMLYLKNGQELDFGGIVKGWTVDKCSDFLLRNGIEDFLINAGGDIFSSGCPEKDCDWIVEIEKTSQIVEISGKAIATSGKTKRFWEDLKGNFYHHILNKKTKRSAINDLKSISVVCDSCVESDVWATAAFSLGKDEGQNLLIENGKKYFLNL